MRVAVAAVLLVAGCKSKSADKAPPSPPVVAPSADAPADVLELPEVSGQGYDKASPAADLTVTTSAFVVDGKPVAPIVDGGAVLSDLGGTAGMVVQPVLHALATRSPTERFTVALDRRVGYRALLQALTTAGDLKATKWAVLARHGADTVALPLELPSIAAPEVSSIPKQLGAIEVGTASVSPATTVSGNAVKSKIASVYIPLLKTCLARAARPEAPAHAAVELGFTIDDTGHTTDASVYGTTVDASSCITDAMKTWLFPVPKDHELVPTTMTAKVTLDVTFDPIAGAAPPPMTVDKPVLGMIVAVARGQISVFSSSGLEGTAAAPKLHVPLQPDGVKDVEATLKDIVQRRWAHAERTADDRRITFLTEDTTPLGAIADLLGVVRRTADGSELFPDVVLGVTR